MNFSFFGKKHQTRKFTYTPRYHESEESASKSKIQFIRPKVSKGTRGGRNAKTVLMILVVVIMALVIYSLKNENSPAEVPDAKFTSEDAIEEVVTGIQLDSVL